MRSVRDPTIYDTMQVFKILLGCRRHGRNACAKNFVLKWRLAATVNFLREMKGNVNTSFFNPVVRSLFIRAFFSFHRSIS